ncbi:glycosyltransferase [Microbacterium aurantiacum]|uniref:glycosyltransferase n=1 Tax=Microbacterium aurantiacum TaxID=162393 RepID=UPI00355868D1
MPVRASAPPRHGTARRTDRAGRPALFARGSLVSQRDDGILPRGHDKVTAKRALRGGGDAVTDPAVSVIVPVYSPGPYIRPLLDCLDRQSPPAGGFEVLFVDDGSADATASSRSPIPPSRSSAAVSATTRSCSTVSAPTSPSSDGRCRWRATSARRAAPREPACSHSTSSAGLSGWPCPERGALSPSRRSACDNVLL